MLRSVAFAVALAGLTVILVGVLDADPIVFFSTASERAAIEHGRVVSLAGAALVLAAAVALRSPLLAFAALLPAALLVAVPGTGFALMALPVAIAAGIAGATLAALPGPDRGRLGSSAALGVLVVVVGAVAGAAFGGVAAGTIAVIAYGHARAAGLAPSPAVARVARNAGFAVVAGTAVLTGGALAG
jgi:hypothetical protein